MEAWCGVCLSRGRRVTPLSAARAAHARLALGADVILPHVCWECRALVDKSILFCERVRRSAKLFASKFQEASVSTFGAVTKVDCEYKFCHGTSIEPVITPHDTVNFDIMEHSSNRIDKYVSFQNSCKEYRNIRQLEAMVDDLEIKPTFNAAEEINAMITKTEKSGFTNSNKFSGTESIITYPSLEYNNVNYLSANNYRVEDSNSHEVYIRETPLNDAGESEQINIGDVPKINIIRNINKTPHYLCNKTVKKIKIKDRTISILQPKQHGIHSVCTYPKLTLNPLVTSTKSVETKSETNVNASDATKADKNEHDEEKSMDEEKSIDNDAEPSEIPHEHTVGSVHDLQDIIQMLATPKRMRQAKTIISYVSEEVMLKCRQEEQNDEPYKNSPFKCETCIVGFVDMISLDEHNKTKHSPELGPCLCDICAERFAGAAQMMEHRLQHYELFGCPACGFRARRMRAVWRHRAAAHLEAVFPCGRCEMIFGTWYQRNGHEESEHSEPRACARCGLRFALPYNYRQHLRRVHGETAPFECASCNKTFARASHLRRHALAHAPPPAAPYCVECDVRFGSAACYRAHLNRSNRHVAPEERRYPCEVCHKRFTHLSYLREHRGAAHHVQNYECADCGKTYVTKGRIQRHILAAHEGVRRPKDKRCDICSKMFTTNEMLNAHKRTHTGERPYSCDICGNTFATRSARWSHRRGVHLNIKSTRNTSILFPCDKCEKIFKRSFALKSHYNHVHLKKETHRCYGCDKNFSTKTQLGCHQRVVHQGVRPPKNKICDICSKGFTTNRLLKNHRLTHTGERPYTCDICGDTFRQTAALYTHRRLKHFKHKHANGVNRCSDLVRPDSPGLSVLPSQLFKS